MKGVVFVGDRKLELRDFPDPSPGPREVVIEIKASGMCGTDLHLYRASAGQPAIPGLSTGQADCANYIADRKLPMDKLFTDRWSLDQAEEAYRHFDTKATGKGVFLL